MPGRDRQVFYEKQQPGEGSQALLTRCSWLCSPPRTPRASAPDGREPRRRSAQRRRHPSPFPSAAPARPNAAPGVPGRGESRRRRPSGHRGGEKPPSSGGARPGEPRGDLSCGGRPPSRPSPQAPPRAHPHAQQLAVEARAAPAVAHFEDEVQRAAGRHGAALTSSERDAPPSRRLAVAGTVTAQDGGAEEAGPLAAAARPRGSAGGAARGAGAAAEPRAGAAASEGAEGGGRTAAEPPGAPPAPATGGGAELGRAGAVVREGGGR